MYELAYAVHLGAMDQAKKPLEMFVEAVRAQLVLNGT
jgi:hypothetical protein